MSSTFLRAIDFRRLITGFISNNFSETVGVNDINYAGFRSGTNNQKFISMWNSGASAVFISGDDKAFLGSPFTAIERNGTYTLRARATISVSYSFSTPGPPLTSSEPITLSEIQNGFNASSLNDARIKAEFSSPINMLSFLGAATPPVITTESQTIASPNYSSVFGEPDWAFPGSVSGFATTDLGSDAVNSVGFRFGTDVVGPIPSDATINSITVTVGTGRTPPDFQPVIPAGMWFLDAETDQATGPSLF